MGDLKPILTKIFQLMDSDKNGHIDEQEGWAIGRALGASGGDAKKWWDTIVTADTDGSGTIELEEWLAYNLAAYKGKEASGLLELQAMYERLEMNLARRTQQQALPDLAKKFGERCRQELTYALMQQCIDEQRAPLQDELNALKDMTWLKATEVARALEESRRRAAEPETTEQQPPPPPPPPCAETSSEDQDFADQQYGQISSHRATWHHMYT